jgi:hypothetical protein
MTVPVAPPSPVEPRRKFWQALFFTKDGRLDLGWLILLVCCVVGLWVFVGLAMQVIPKDAIPQAAWAWFSAFTTMAFIAGAATARAALIAKSTTVGAVAQAIAATSEIQERRAEGGDYELTV